MKKRSQKPGTVVGIVARKGGVGKTFTTLNLATWFALRGWSTAILECDDNRKLTYILNANDRRPPLDRTTYPLFYPKKYAWGDPQVHNRAEMLQRSTYVLPLGIQAGGAFTRTSIVRDHRERIMNEFGWQADAQMTVIPGARELRDMDAQYTRAAMLAALEHEDQIGNPITAEDIQSFSVALSLLQTMYDFVFVDTPPSLTAVMHGAVFGCNYVILPVEMFPSSWMDIQETLDTISEIQSRQSILGRTPVKILGYVASRMENIPEFQQTLQRYSETTMNATTGQQTPPLIPYPRLGAIPLNSETVFAAEYAAIPAILAAPKKPGIGTGLVEFARTVEGLIQ